MMAPLDTASFTRRWAHSYNQILTNYTPPADFRHLPVDIEMPRKASEFKSNSAGNIFLETFARIASAPFIRFFKLS